MTCVRLHGHDAGSGALRLLEQHRSADRPKRVTAAEWERRRKVWDGITCTQLGFRSVLQITIVDSDRWLSVDPYIEILQEIPLPKTAFRDLFADPHGLAAEVELTAKLDAKHG